MKAEGQGDLTVQSGRITERAHADDQAAGVQPTCPNGQVVLAPFAWTMQSGLSEREVMKGVVFREFLDHAEAVFGVALVDQVLETADLPSGGAYTSVGYYDHEEMLALVGRTSELTGKSVRDLLVGFGSTLFRSLIESHAQKGVSHPFDLLERIHGVIHRDVRKLYPDAEVPEIIVVERVGEGRIVVEYRSARPMADLCEGMIKATFAYYGKDGDYDIIRLDNDGAPLREARFDITIGADTD